MATLSYELGKPKKDNSRKVSLILSHKGKRKRIETNIIVHDSDISRTGRILSRKVVKVIDDKMKVYRDRLFDLEIDIIGSQVDVEWIYNRLTSKQREELDFFGYTENWIRKSSNKGKGNYAIMLNSLERFVGVRRLSFDTIDYNFLNRYKTFLEGHPRAQSLYLGNIRHIFNEARKELNDDFQTLIPSNPFEKFSVPKDNPQTKDRVISVEDLVKVIQFQGTGRMGLARDCYVLSFFLMGMNSVDLYQCSIYKKGVLKYDRAKTRDRRNDNAHIEIVVPETIKPLMKKYSDTSRVFSFHKMYSNPANFNKNINIGLHQLADELKIERFDFYSARHTWASIARNKLGIDKFTIHEALNHVSQLDITDIYIQKDFTNINKANNKVVEYIEGLIKK